MRLNPKKIIRTTLGFIIGLCLGWALGFYKIFDPKGTTRFPRPEYHAITWAIPRWIETLITAPIQSARWLAHEPEEHNSQESQPLLPTKRTLSLTPETKPRDTKKNPVLTLLPSTLTIYPTLSSVTKPLIPFLVIKDIFTHNATAFLQHTAAASKSADVSESRLSSSCVNTVFALSTLFMGEAYSKTILAYLKKFMSISLAIQLPSGKVWNYWCINVFEGNILIDICNDLKRSNAKRNAITTVTLSDENITRCASVGVTTFFQYIKPITKGIFANTCDNDEAIEKIKEKILEFDFNALTITTIKKEMEDNRRKTNLTASHIYMILISTMNAKSDLPGFEHVFLIEQFYLNQTQEVRYRLYQSWINEATLIDDFNKRGYGENGAGSWNELEMKSFLESLKSCYSQNNTPYNTRTKQCFGYPEHHRANSTGPLLQFKDNRLSGVCVRYYSDSVDPQQCLNNLAKLLHSNPALAQNMRSDLANKLAS